MSKELATALMYIRYSTIARWKFPTASSFLQNILIEKKKMNKTQVDSAWHVQFLSVNTYLP